MTSRCARAPCPNPKGRNARAPAPCRCALYLPGEIVGLACPRGLAEIGIENCEHHADRAGKKRHIERYSPFPLGKDGAFRFDRNDGIGRGHWLGQRAEGGFALQYNPEHTGALGKKEQRLCIPQNGVDLAASDPGWARCGFNHGLRIHDGDGHTGRGKAARAKLRHGVLQILGGKLCACFDPVGDTLDHLRQMRRRAGKSSLVLQFDIVAPGQKRENAGHAENNQENDDECRDEAAQDGFYDDEFAISRPREKADMARKPAFPLFPAGFAMRPRRRAIRVGARHLSAPLESMEQPCEAHETLFYAELYELKSWFKI